MTRDTFIKHKKVAMIFEESGLVIGNYNALITQLESNLVAHPISFTQLLGNNQPIQIVIKQVMQKKCHNMKKE
jgi:hypothetical protein